METKIVVEQIQAKLKSKKKLPTWFNTPNIYYPSKLNIEQTSSEKTAIYKSNLVQGNTLLDLTGGFGVDSYYFAKVFNKVIHCEINPELSQIAAHNFQTLKQDNIICKAVDGMEFLATSDKVDCIYLDPSRRDQTKKKVFLLRDCTPDITEIHTDLLSKASKVLVKVSPLVDISKAIQDVNQINEIHIVAVNNQVKEMLLLLTKDTSNTLIKAVNIKEDTTEEFSFDYFMESESISNYTPPLTYLYEPNAAILKSGGFDTVSQYYNINKLHSSTHLYTSDQLIDFPGRRFLIKQIIPYNKQGIKILKGYTKANISIRNFPQSVDKLRLQLKIKDGGSDYIFFCTESNNAKIAIITVKVS
ncbi:class I SAM-dependent methyltransferase [Galbibacter sp.]|uniref:class I SAM-dependent methyltransferase n=1 Tax=Galbibacter sp. TaxID=2918471 RepID=UPI003A8EE9D5